MEYTWVSEFPIPLLEDAAALRSVRLLTHVCSFSPALDLTLLGIRSFAGSPKLDREFSANTFQVSGSSLGSEHHS